MIEQCLCLERGAALEDRVARTTRMAEQDEMLVVVSEQKVRGCNQGCEQIYG